MQICVFLGSRFGNRPVYSELAVEFGSLIARSNIGLVYGGGSVGLMGAIAMAASRAGGKVIGVIPENLRNRECENIGATEIHVVDTMHQRKAKMAELSDAFVALPGGIGTLEELFEVWTWAQLGYHSKPCCLLNVDGYYDPLIAFTDRMVSEGFLDERHRNLLLVEQNSEDLIHRITSFEPAVFEERREFQSVPSIVLELSVQEKVL